MTRDDVERIIENTLANLEIRVSDGDYTSPNSRKVVLLFNGKEISYDYFDVVQKDEYEG